MHDFAENNILPTKVLRGYLSQDGPVDDGVLHQTRAALGAIRWLAATTRPDLASACSLIPGYFADRDKRMVSEVNTTVKQAKELRYDVTIWPIPPSYWRVVAFCDSTTDTSWKQRRQKGYVVGVLNRYFSQGDRVPVIVLFRKSANHTRKASSPQLCETYAASDCVVEVAWMKCLLESITWTDFGIVERRRRSRPRAGGRPHMLPDEQPHLSGTEAIIVSPTSRTPR